MNYYSELQKLMALGVITLAEAMALDSTWVLSGGFPKGTWGLVPQAPTSPPEVIERAGLLRAARDARLEHAREEL